MATKEVVKKKKPKYFLHKGVLIDSADRLAMTSSLPSKTIYNVLFKIYSLASTEGWLYRQAQTKKFKDKREQHRKNSFNMVRDHIDKIIDKPKTT